MLGIISELLRGLCSNVLNELMKFVEEIVACVQCGGGRCHISDRPFFVLKCSFYSVERGYALFGRSNECFLT